MRKAKIYIGVGTNGTGKTTTLKTFLKANSRNLILPANKLDKAWNDYPTLQIKSRFVLDPKDYKQKRKILDLHVPKLNTFKGNQTIHIEPRERKGDEWDRLFEFVVGNVKGFKDGGLFIDDFKNYIKGSGLLPNGLRRLFGDRRHRMLDIFMASHSLQDINAELLQFEPTIILFKTTRPPNKSVQDKIQNYDQLLETFERVNKRAKKNPYYCEKFIPTL